jgi:hypothetical protein
VLAALDRVAEFIRPTGPFAGIHVVDPDVNQLRSAIGRGYRFIGFASEMLIFSERMEELAAGIESVR